MKCFVRGSVYLFRTATLLTARVALHELSKEQQT